MARGTDGTAYIGGDFSAWGTQTGSRAALDANVNSSAPVRRSFPRVVGTVSAVAADGSGGWHIGGTSTKVGERARANLAHFEANGAVTSAWNPGTNGEVRALATSTISAGGRFTTLSSELRGGSPSTYIAPLKTTDPCGSGIGLTTGQWAMLALPCVPGGITVEGTFGNAPAANLDAKLYSTGCALFRRIATAAGSGGADKELILSDDARRRDEG